jgi:hypothetical protein
MDEVDTYQIVTALPGDPNIYIDGNEQFSYNPLLGILEAPFIRLGGGTIQYYSGTCLTDAGEDGVLYVESSDETMGYIEAQLNNSYIYGPGVNQNDAVPASLRVRATGLKNTPTAPTYNGQIVWTYG